MRLSEMGEEQRQQRRTYSQAYRIAHHDELLAYYRAYHFAHRGEKNAYRRAYRLAHPEKETARTIASRPARRAKHLRIAALVSTWKAGPCLDCGGRFPPECMDFDHVRGTKRFSLSRHGGRGEAQLRAEAAKCDVVCANCHRIRTKARKRAA